MRDKIIRIHWSHPLPFDKALTDENANTQGLYYITRVFGTKETSIYLGIATMHNTIKHRLEAHRDRWISLYRGQIYVRFGSIVYPNISDMETKALLIDHAESAILFEPEHISLFPKNICKRNSYTYSDVYRIENTGDNFELQPSIRMHEHEDA